MTFAFTREFDQYPLRELLQQPRDHRLKRRPSSQRSNLINCSD